MIKIHSIIDTHINLLNLIPFFNRYKIFTDDEIKYFISDYQLDPCEHTLDDLSNQTHTFYDKVRLNLAQLDVKSWLF